MPRVSKIWDYFVVNAEDTRKARCTLCSTSISRGGTYSKQFTTTNLKSHLRCNHGAIYKEFEEAQRTAEAQKRQAKEDRDRAGPSTSKQAKQAHQMQLKQMVDKVTLWTVTDPRTLRANARLAEMISLDLQPFNIVNNVGFQRLCSVLEPRYQLPSRQHISSKLIPNIFERVKAKVSEELKDMSYISLSTDIWSSTVGANSLMSLTGHWISEDFERKHCVLNASSFVGRHTGEAICAEIERMLATWELEHGKVVAILRDNAANVINGLTRTGINHQGCFIHTLQLVVHDGLSTQRSVNDMLAIGRRIAGHFNHSPLAHHRLQELQVKHELPQHHITQDVPTRWNSSFLMLERLLEQKTAIAEYASLYDIPVMTTSQWNLARALVVSLRRFEELTRKASESASSSSMVIPSVTMLQRSLAKHTDDQGIKTLTTAMYASLNRRFDDMENNKILVLATFLDPHYKCVFFKVADTRAKASDWLREESSLLTTKVDVIETQEEQPHPRAVDTFDDEFDQFLQEKGAMAPQAAQGQHIGQEIGLFLADPLQERSGNPLQWWKFNCHRFPLLAKLARKYLCVPPSSVPSERLFSEAGDLYEEKRNRLDPAKAEMILFIRGNLPRLDFKY
ncbi:zinc finger BED domain-containing protein 4-like [Apostichopus japonicus]|uniref:zinc finger BED domain-containing protein 4-like n=1 Tax=Stichopus japonicus TaxID=307972 RepID=UPI003AB1CE9D